MQPFPSLRLKLNLGPAASLTLMCSVFWGLFRVKVTINVIIFLSDSGSEYMYIVPGVCVLMPVLLSMIE